MLTFLLARWLQSGAYGAFAVVFATLLFVSGFHNVLLLEPMSVIGPACYASQISSYLATQLKIHTMLATLLAGVLLLVALLMRLLGANVELAGAIAASAFALPFFLLLWLVRRMAYMVQRPDIAGWASAGYFLLTLAGLIVLHWKNVLAPVTAFLLMGCAGLLSASFPLRRLGSLHPKVASQCCWKEVVHENWKYGRWLVLSTALFSVTAQIQTYEVAGVMGLSAAGVLRAMQVPSLVMTQIVTAVGLLVLPSMSYEFGLRQFDQLRRKAVLTSMVVTAIAVGYAAILFFLSSPIERWLYRGKYAHYAMLIPILGFVPACTGFAVGFSMALRATQKSHIDLIANAISAPVGLVTAALFIKFWGLNGAGLSLVVSFAAYAAVFFWSFTRPSRKAEPQSS